MEKVIFKTVGTCSTSIQFERDDQNCIHNITFEGGCKGNLKAIGLLCEGMKAEKIAEILGGNTCGSKKTSCADQLAKAVMQKPASAS